LARLANVQYMVDPDTKKVIEGTVDVVEEGGEAGFRVAKTSIRFSQDIDIVLNKLKAKCKYVLEGTGEYSKVKGHHPVAKKAFEGDQSYDYQKAFCVAIESLEKAWKTVNKGIPQNLHAKVTANQNSLYSAFAKTGKRLEIGDLADIEIKAMTNAGLPDDIATGWVVKALEDLKNQGVTEIVNIPWNGINK